jgi:hypothetical protein
MNLRNLLVITTIVSGLFGIVFVLIPWQVLSLYGAQPDPAINYIGRLFGAVLISISILCWSARNVGPSDALKAIVRGLFVGECVGFVVSVIAQVNGVVNNLGWSTVIIYLFFSIGYGYFYFA